MDGVFRRLFYSMSIDLGVFFFIIISRQWSRQHFVFMVESACAGYREEDVLNGCLYWIPLVMALVC
jgi:hypothetical protein